MAPTTDLHLLSGAYALDALDELDRARFERHLRDCDECVHEVGEFHETTAALADRIRMTPPDGMRDRVLREVAMTRQAPSTSRMHRPRFSLRRALATAAAAVVLVGGAGLAGVTWQQHQAAEHAQAEAASIARVMTADDRVEVAGHPAGGGTATVVAAGGSAVFAADRLRTLPSNRAYQLWLVDGAGSISSLGLLDVSDGSGQAVLRGVRAGTSVAISVEPSGGSRQPTTTPLIALKVV